MAEATSEQSSKSAGSRPPEATLRGASYGAIESGFESRLLSLQRMSGNRAVRSLLNSTMDETRLEQMQAGGREANTSVPTNVIPSIVNEVLRSPGEPLDASTRASMESRFGYDFGQVRIHRDAQAARSASAVNAYAYTAGRDIAFACGAFEPETPAGRHLLAHELAHVVQQRSRSVSLNLPLSLDSRSSNFEREADQAANQVVTGASGTAPQLSFGGSVQRLQRAERGTYVSTVGPQEYLDAGEQFYKTWGHPNVKRVATMVEILRDLDRGKGPIDTFRIVAHGSPSGLQLGLLPEISPEGFGVDQASFTTEGRFREVFIGRRMVNESTFEDILKALQQDATTSPLLVTLGADKDVPAPETPVGIVLRAIVESRFLEDAELDTGGQAVIANVGELKAFNSARIKTYGKLVINASPKASQKKVAKAISDLQANVSAAMSAAGLSFGTFTAAEAGSFAEPFLETVKSRKRLQKELTKSVEEGAGGPYLRTLQSVKSKVSDATHIEIRGCNVGGGLDTLDAFRSYFGRPDSLPSISAPDLYQYYFQLGVESYGTHPDEDARLEAAFADPSTGLAQGFEDLRRTKAGDMTRVTNEKTLSELATKYGFSAAAVRKLNPEIEDPDALQPDTIVWLKARTEIRAGIHKTLKSVCKDYLGDEKLLPKLTAANPGITDPESLSRDDRITIPKDLLKTPIVGPTPTAAEVKAEIRKGEPVAAFNTSENKPYVHVHDPKRAQALGKWLAAQKFDPKGRTAAELSKLFPAGNKAFEKARKGRYIQFLSRDYPNVADPIFPDDPRYDKHIIRRP